RQRPVRRRGRSRHRTRRQARARLPAASRSERRVRRRPQSVHHPQADTTAARWARGCAPGARSQRAEPRGLRRGRQAPEPGRQRGEEAPRSSQAAPTPARLIRTVDAGHLDTAYQEALAWLFGQTRAGGPLHPRRARNLIDALALRVPDELVRVVGTNGKGTVSSMIAAGSSAAGRKTGRFLSPHVESFTERVAIDGVEV